ncbi:hypothetical protein [Acinetobacter sp. YH12245]|uniref:hypothetical protein n=1 Tax=Acinetobacter sp. YH12245 TaxID=2601171 RepID=UPI0015D17C3B|nr:hypothetical protein [Acinetobacter sp. YH12245]
MVDQPVTKEKLINANKDVQVIEDFIKKPKDETVTTRFGDEIMTLKGLEEEVKKSGGYFKRYTSLAAANADIANIPVDAVVKVTSAVDGGDYEKVSAGATNLTKSAHDPLKLSKDYTDSIVTNVTAVAFTVEGYISATGSLLSTSTFKSTDFIKVTPGEIYRIYSQIAGVARHAWYDKNKVFISAFGEDQTTLTEKTYTAPLNAAYVRVSAYQPTAWNVAYIKSKAYNADVVQKIIQQHMPQVDASKIDYNSSNVKATLDTVISKQDTIIANQNGIIGQLDLMTDKESPYFVNTAMFVKASNTPTNFNIVNVVSRVSDSEMTVSDATAFVLNGSCVVFDAVSDNYTSHSVIGIDGTTIKVIPNLPTNPSKAQTMHDEAQGQHLSLFGYKGLADFIVNQTQKYGYKKTENRIFSFNPTYCDYRVWNDSDIYALDKATKLISVTRLGSASNGGVVAGTSDLAKLCAMSLTLNSDANTQYLSKVYYVTETTVGSGFEFSFNAGGGNGFIEIPLSACNKTYKDLNNLDKTTSGRARLQVFNGTTEIHNQVYEVGCVHDVFVDFANADTLTIRVTCADAVPTMIYLGGVFAYKKSANTSKDGFFKNGDSCLFVGDSWTQYPLATAIGEPAAAYPISKMSQAIKDMYPYGHASRGTQWVSKRIKEKLAVNGVNIETINMGLGGQTSKWGKYWLDEVLNMPKKPTHCVICFYINDRGSIENPSWTTYDFDPELMFSNKTVANGGVSGRLESYEQWEKTVKFISDKCISNGIKPIIFMPSQTASNGQTHGIRLNQLSRLADGFN